MDAPAEDGPLWRAIIGSSERRITTLRMGLKAMKHGLEAALDALHKDSAANEAIDAALSELSVTSSTSKSNVLGGLYERALRESRIQRGRRIREEVRTHDDLMRRLKDSYERLKALEGRKKAFEAASKAYYDDVSKVSYTLLAPRSVFADSHYVYSTSRGTRPNPPSRLHSIRRMQPGPSLSSRLASTTSASSRGSSAAKRTLSPAGYRLGRE
jgi:uncharacterized protein YhaN